MLGAHGHAAILDRARGSMISRWQASKTTLSRAVFVPGKGTALVAGSSISLFDIASGSRLCKWPGHSNPIRAMRPTADGSYCFTAAEGERSAALWCIRTHAETGKPKYKASVDQLHAQQPIIDLSVHSVKNTSSVFHVVALTHDGNISVFCCTDSNDHRSEKREVLHHRTASVEQWAVSRTGGVIAVGIESADSTWINLIVATGSSARPLFQKLRVDKQDDGDDVIVVDIPLPDAGDAGLFSHVDGAEQKVSKSDNKGSATNTSAAVVGVGSIDDMVGNGHGMVMTRTVPKENKRKLNDDDVELDDDDVVLDDDDDDIVDDNDNGDENADAMDDGPTFAERIAALQQEDTPQLETATTKSTKKIHGDIDASSRIIPSGPLKADSLSVLLTQALQSNDKLLLERCFTVRNKDIIKKTVSRIRPTEASALLKCLVQRLQSSPSRGEQLTVWIRTVLVYHTAYLSSVSTTSGLLTYLYQIIESRLSSYQPLLSLNGRLDLVLANATRKESFGDDADDSRAGGKEHQVLLTVGVDADGGVDVEDAFAAVALDENDDDDDEDVDEEADFLDDEDDDFMEEDD